jgi:hypothetical protein
MIDTYGVPRGKMGCSTCRFGLGRDQKHARYVLLGRSFARMRIEHRRKINNPTKQSLATAADLLAASHLSY